jgi:DNA-binding response OmpR family regulator
MKENNRVLFADDDADTRKIVGEILQSAGIETVFADSGSQAIKAWQAYPVDLIILDYMMPGMDGIETCRRIRQSSFIPIILLTAKGREEDIIKGFKAGVDDYIVKPIRTREFIARVQAILNRVTRQPTTPDRQMVFEDLVLDARARQVISQGRKIYLSPLEFRLLQYLMQHAGMTISKIDLLYNVWGFCELAGEINFIEAAIKRLRHKIEPNPSHPKYIQTVWGTGYRFGDN